MARRKTITAKWLEKETNACPKMVERFRQVFGERCDFTRANLIKAAKTGQQPSWIRYNVLTYKGHITYNTLMNKKRRMSRVNYEIASANTIADILGLD